MERVWPRIGPFDCCRFLARCPCFRSPPTGRLLNVPTAWSQSGVHSIHSRFRPLVSNDIVIALVSENRWSGGASPVCVGRCPGRCLRLGLVISLSMQWAKFDPSWHRAIQLKGCGLTRYRFPHWPPRKRSWSVRPALMVRGRLPAGSARFPFRVAGPRSRVSGAVGLGCGFRLSMSKCFIVYIIYT